MADSSTVCVEKNFMKYCKYIIPVFVLLLCGLNLHASYSVSEEWSTYVGGQNGNDSVKASVIDANSMIYFGGAVYGGQIDDEVEATEYPFDGGGVEGFIARAYSDGVLQWYSSFGGNGYDEIRGIAEDGQSVYAVACLEQISSYYDGTDAYLYSLSNTNGSFNWSYYIGEADATNAFNAVTVDTNGNIYAVGYTSIDGLSSTVDGYQVNGTGPVYGSSLQGDLDAVVVKVSPAGSLLWVHYLGGENHDSALACTIGTNGYLYVGGETCSTGWVSDTSSTFPSPSNKAGFVVKLSTDGEHKWSTFLGGTYNDSVSSLAIESESGNLFAAGTTFSGDYMYNGNPLNSHGGGSDGFVTSITDNGNDFTINWSKFYGSPQDETISSIQQLNESELVVGGTTPNGTWLPDADNAHSGGNDGFIVVLQEDSGTNIWSTYTGGSDTETLNTIAARNGIFYAGGMTRSEGWVTNGFHTTWDKESLWEEPADEFGFLFKYQSSGYVADPPEITLQPQSVTVEEQQDAQFTIAAVGTQPLFYQWRVNGSSVADATNTIFSLSSVQRAQDGDLISCVLSNVAGTVFSDNALLTVTPIPNGWITVDISPTNAVNAGAAWSLDSGSTWYVDGDVVNVITGIYSIVYKDVFGWSASSNAPASTVVTNGYTNLLATVYTEVFYDNYREISGTNVTVVIDPPDGSETVIMTETLQEGLIPHNFAPLSWDIENHKLTYKTFDTTPIQFTYSVTGTDGVYQVSGAVNFGEGSVITAGPDQIVIGGTTSVVPDPDIISFGPDSGTPGNFLLTFNSISGQDYLVETNGTPAAFGWAQQGQQVSGQAEQTTTSVGAPYPVLFYRVRTPAQ